MRGAAAGKGNGEHGEQVATPQACQAGHVPLAPARSAGLTKASAVVSHRCLAGGQAGARRTLTVRYCGVRPSRSVGTNKGDETARSRAGNHTVQKALVMPGSMLGASSKTITHCAQNEY